jgi:predicted permease
MYVEIFTIIAPVFICALLGYVWARSGQPYETQFVSNIVMNIGAPALIIGTLSKVSMPAEHFTDIVIATSLIIVITGALAAALCVIFRLPMRAYLPSLTFPNTGNIGLPLCLFAFGEQGLAVGLGFFLVMSVSHFSVGMALVSGGSMVKGVLKSPIIYASLISVVLIYQQWYLPLWLSNTFTLLGELSIPLMLITLGVSLERLRIGDVIVSTSLSIARLVIGLGVGLLVAEWLALEGVIRGVVIIQSAMPAAIFNYLLAQRFGQSPESVAGMVVISTLLSFLTLPFVLWLVL